MIDRLEAIWKQFIRGLRPVRRWIARLLLPIGPTLIIAALAATLLVTGLLAWMATETYRKDLTLIWTALGTIFAGEAVLLAAAAGIVAAIAYKQTLRRPHLIAEFWIRPMVGTWVMYNKGAETGLKRSTPQRAWPGGVAPAPRGIVAVESRVISLRVVNDGLASARNISMLLWLRDVAWFGLPAGQPAEWTTRDTDWDLQMGWRVLRWEGGADYAVHADGGDRWWDFDLTNFWVSPDSSPTLTLVVSCDGMSRQRFEFPVSIQDD